MPNRRFTRDARFALAAAADCAKVLKHTYVGTEHLLLGLLRMAPALFPGERAVEELEDRVYTQAAAPIRKAPSRSDEQLPYTSLAKAVLRSAHAVATKTGTTTTDVNHLLAALVSDKGKAGEILRQSGFHWDWVGTQITGRDPKVAALELIQLDDESDVPYYEQIVARIREAVASGELNFGNRLPSVRSLADHLGIAPGTVARAFALLEQEGVVETAGAKGTTIASPTRAPSGSPEERIAGLGRLLRPVVVAAFHLGATAEELFEALRTAVAGVFEDPLGLNEDSA